MPDVANLLVRCVNEGAVMICGGAVDSELAKVNSMRVRACPPAGASAPPRAKTGRAALSDPRVWCPPPTVGCSAWNAHPSWAGVQIPA